MAGIDDIRDERLKKIRLLAEAGMEAYPSETRRTHDVAALREQFDALLAEKAPVAVAGRIRSVRGQGGIVFADIDDGTGRIQAVFKKDEMDARLFELFEKTADPGDFVEVSGAAYTTKRGERSVFAESWRMLGKGLRPVPDEWFGLKDEDERYRKRYLDILLTKGAADRIRRRSKFWNSLRAYLLARGFVEVETPALETTTGGADARPFSTRHHALDMDVYLRISAGELWQKRLLVAGLPKVFEIGRIFRNEGMSAEHAQDYTQLEFYEAYKDYRQGMAMITDMYRAVAKEVYGTLEFDIRGHRIDLEKKWETYDFNGLMKKEYGLDPRDALSSRQSWEEALRARGVACEKGAAVERLVDAGWKQVRKTLAGPGFLVDVPVYLEPLAKKSAQDPRVVERFQVIIAGSEVGKGFSELNDPVEQSERFKRQGELRAEGDEEAQMPDAEYVEAMEYGMPPALGFGVSERLFAFFEGVSVREAQVFPLMRPRP